MRREFFIPVFLLLINCFIFSCREDETGPGSGSPVITERGTESGAAVSITIGSGGGSFQSADGILTVIVPAGALTTSTTLTIQPITNEAPMGQGGGYRLGPEGATFAKPVQLKFTYDEQSLDGTLEDFLWIVTQAEDRSWNGVVKSVIDKTANTVTVETTHFSDWAMGRFMELSLVPSSATLKKGESLSLKLNGFQMPQEELDELAPLTLIKEEPLDELTPITSIQPAEERLLKFRVVKWTLNGSAAPVSGSSGSLSATKSTATYKAPNIRPANNPVAVTVELEASTHQGTKFKYLITSSISIVESDLYLLVKVDGTEYEYYQYGFDGAVPPDPNTISIANCAITSSGLQFGGSMIINNSESKNFFAITLEKPAVKGFKLGCWNEQSQDEVTFTPNLPPAWTNAYTDRKWKNDFCDYEYLCSDFFVLVEEFDDNNIIKGEFFGTIYEDKANYEDECRSPDKHLVSGKFRLFVIK